MPYRQFLMACSALVGMCLLIPAAASAQSASDGDKIQNLERQTELLQKQLKEIKDELARSRKKATEQQQQYEAVAADASFRDRFEREMLMMARFQHPYVVTLYDASLDDPLGPCIVMEYVKGLNLDQVLARNERLPAARVATREHTVA